MFSFVLAFGQAPEVRQDTIASSSTVQMLELSRQERLILQQQAELQRVELAAAKERQNVLLVTILFSIIIISILVFLILRTRRSSRIIEEQNRVLAKQQRNLKHAQYELKKTLKIAQDSSRRLHRSNVQLKQMQSQLIQVEKMSSLGQLTAGIVHEINNPVNFVKGGIEMLDKNLRNMLELFEELKEADKEDKIIKRSIEVIKKDLDEELRFSYEIIPQIMQDVIFGTNRISEIVNGLRIFSRQGESTSSFVNVHELIDSALLILHNKTVQVTNLTKKYDPDIDEIECYPGLLNQVFVNIISNAIDAVDTNGHIEIETIDLGERILVKVIDNGVGIEDKNLKHIFEPFFTTKEVGKGTGIGLSISYSIIKKHGGSIEVLSKPGAMTVFSIQLKKRLNDEIIFSGDDVPVVKRMANN